MFDGQSYSSQIEELGYAVVTVVISPSRVAELRAAIGELPDRVEVRRREQVYGIRNLLEISDATRRLAGSAVTRALVTSVLGEDCFAVRATFFDKVAGANWKLRWHQDCVIAVPDRVEVDGFSAWSNKAGVVQVRPPERVLRRMLAIRVHLDDCPARNGALRVMPGSHARHRSREEIVDCKSTHAEVVCEVPCGGVLAMRPLLVHASAPSETPAHRRVIHLEYASDPLPGGLQWKWRVGMDG